MSGRGIFLIVVFTWVALISAGTAKLFQYESKPGLTRTTSAHWPAASRLARDPNRPSLVLFMHPKCPCSRATLAELAQIVTRHPGRVSTHVLFVRPPAEPVDWEKTDLWAEAVLMPGVDVRTDSAGVEAQRFGALTSGYTSLYDTRGLLQFAGGITGGRGHVGTNRGLETVLAILGGTARTSDETFPVFGCALLNAADSAWVGEVACRRP